MHVLCPVGGQGLSEALAATSDFGAILAKLPYQPAEALKGVATHGSPLVQAEALALGAALMCWFLYLLTRNCSHVDRMWSTLAPVYVAIFARKDLAAVMVAVRGLAARGCALGSSPIDCLAALRSAVTDSGADTRLLLATVLSAAWGCRLTYNFWRRGGYNPRFEDHRWLEVRKIMHPHALCLLITLPAFVAATLSTAPPRPLGPADWAAAATFALFLLGEAAADQQQWAFQRRKHQREAERLPRSGDLKRGFRTTGLFRFSRHPNFFCEYGMWWSFYVLCAVLPCGCLLGWSVAGAAGLTLLLHAGSLWITERISSARYPQYADYQASTSAIIPGRPGPRLKDD
ncbi:hypothetical protein PLESTF_000438800 [Pleodorina starrii]|nr:hypothetical protein PLESTF_000438800 [Pleodorina starrii]